MKNKKWFTLVEIIMVIVIIAILLSLSMWISGNRVKELKVKSAQEQFVYNYNNLFSKNLLTNYNKWTIYENMIIKMENNKDFFLYWYKWYNQTIEDMEFTKDFIQWWEYSIIDLKLDWNNKDIINIKFSPYVLWCELSDWNNTWEILEAKALINTTKEYCFQLSSYFCKQEDIPCR